ncbi:carbon catabolite repressor protein 4 homolog 6 [Humulus lupulus]|uniref:carbon catabolite repressor protein 4 homolog 6 n=1 Tax=Humulus lupulus TaxID=3486 RepID=UPI002B40D4E3|nr:carbon catabolite repressor protein 4 homolog 6 [Humulus lupulus]XP_062101674.1 carbon catabolite repressor protein 4 homolog 6 [Humulus lupulus]
MRRPLHRLRLFVTDLSSTITTTSMSSYRGGRNHPRRNLSDRPFIGGRRGHYVSDGSHFRPVREANLGFHQGEGGSFRNDSEFPMPDRPPHPNQNQQFRPGFYQNHQQFRPPFPPYSYQNQQFRRPPALPFEHNQPRRVALAHQYRPRPRPPDFRNWEFAKTSPPSTSERFTILSYNILADYLATDHRSRLYYHIPRYMLDWQWRKKNILFELGLWSTDIICFQEVDRFQGLEEELKFRGYSGIWKRRTGYHVDGCAIFWRSSRFKLLHEESIEFNKLGLRDNVAQICVLELLSQKCDENAAALQTSSTSSNKVVVCNIHVLFNPRRGEIKLGQVRTLLDRAHAVSKVWSDAPVVLCGDFNCVPKSPLYNYISEQKLDLSVVDRNKLSGQASAEIREQRTYNPNYGVKSGDNLVRAPLMVQGNEVVKMNESSLDMQKPFDLDSSPENLPLVENFSQLHSHNALSVNDRSSTSTDHERNDVKVGDEVKEETQKTPVYEPSDSCTSTYGISGASLRKDICTSYCEGGSSTGNLTPEKMDNSINLLFTGSSEPTNYLEEERKSCDNILQSLPDVTCSFMVETDAKAYSQTTSSCDINKTSPQNSEDSSPLQVCSDRQGDFSDTSQAHLAFSPTSIEVQEKVDNLTLDETMIGGGNIAEDSSTFLSALHNYEEDFSCDPGQLLRSGTVNSNPSSNIGVEGDLPTDLDLEQPLEVEENFYDPSLWTPADIETATGNATCTFLEHPLKLKSTYTEVEDCLGTRDSNGEPLVTSYHRCFLGTVDYIWRSEGLQTVKVLSPIPKHVMQATPGFPTKKWGSDHIALASELAFVKDNTNNKVDV